MYPSDNVLLMRAFHAGKLDDSSIKLGEMIGSAQPPGTMASSSFLKLLGTAWLQLQVAPYKASVSVISSIFLGSMFGVEKEILKTM